MKYLLSSKRRNRNRQLVLEQLEVRTLLSTALISNPKLTSPNVPYMDWVFDEGYPHDISWEPNRLVLTDGKWESGTVLIRNKTGRPLTEFTATMELHLSGGTGGYGVSFGYAPMSGGEFGAGGQVSRGGLWFLIDTYTGGDGWTGLKVYYGNKLVKSDYEPQDQLRGKWKTVVVEMKGNGTGYYTYQGAVGRTRFTVPNWQPSSHWRFGVGGQTKGRWDKQSLEDLWITEYTDAPRTPSLSGSSGTVWDGSAGTPSLSWSASDPDNDLKNVTANVKLDGSALSGYSTNTTKSPWSGSFSLDKDLGLGTYLLSVTANDKSNLSRSNSRSYTLRDDDVAPPVIVLNGDDRTERHSLPQSFEWDVFDQSDTQFAPAGIGVLSVEVTRDDVIIYPDPNDPAPPPPPAEGEFNFDSYGPGEYVITIVADDADTDRNGDSKRSTATQKVIVTNDAPQAVAGLNQTVFEGENVFFDGSRSSDPDEEPLTYTWDFGDGATGTGVTTSHVYTDDRTYHVTLTVEDAYGETSTDSFDVVSLNVAPSITSVTDDGPVGVGESITVTISAADVAGDPLSYEFDFDNDGTYEASNTTGSAVHTFAVGNLYPVNGRVSDGDGGEATGFTVVLVGSPAATQPAVSFETESQIVGENVGQVTIAAQLAEALTTNALVPLVLSGAASVGSDYALPFAYLLIPAGTTQNTVTVSIIDDSRDEYDEDLVLSMGTPVNASLGDVTTHTITITDNDDPPEVSFTEASRTAVEDVGAVTVQARVNEISEKQITIPLSLSGTATSPADYSFAPGPQVVIPAGAEIGFVTLNIVDDTTPEPNETVIADMGVPSNATVSVEAGTTSTHVATIPENDAPSISFTSAYRRVEENVGGVTLTAELSVPYFAAIDVPLVFSGTVSSGDYNVSVTSLHFDAWETTATTTITVVDDNEPESGELLKVGLAPVGQVPRLGATRSSYIDIAANDTPSVYFSTSGQTAWEDAGTRTVTVQLSHVLGHDIQVPVFVSGGTASDSDYVLGSQFVTIQGGQSSGSTTLQIINDSENESTESISLSLSSPLNTVKGSPSRQIITVKDDDPLVRFTSNSPKSVQEGNSVSIAVQLSAKTNKPVTVPLAVVGTASKDYDYEVSPLSLSVPVDQTVSSTSITLDALEDSIIDAKENVRFLIQTPTNASQGIPSSHTVKIVDTNELTVSISKDSTSSIYWAKDVNDGVARTGTLVFEMSVPSDEQETFQLTTDASVPIDVSLPDFPTDVTFPSGTTSVDIDFDAISGGLGEIPVDISVEGFSTTHRLDLATCYGERLQTGMLVLSDNCEESLFNGSSAGDENFLDRVTADLENIASFVGVKGYVDGATAFLDANKNGVLDFVDLNLDGIQDPNEPTEISVATDSGGRFQFSIPEHFDTNGNGFLDPDEGQVVLAGGTDTSTGLPLTSNLIAPPGMYVVSPISTLAAALVNDHAFDVLTAQQRVGNAFGLTGVGLGHLDSIAATIDGATSGPDVFAINAVIHDTVTQLASLVGNLPDSPPASHVAKLAITDLATKIVEPDSGLDLGNPLLMETIIEGTMDRAGLSLSATTLSGAAEVIAASNAHISEIPRMNNLEFLTKVVQTEAVAQGTVAARLAEVAQGQVDIATVVQENSGAALAAQIDAATVGNIVPVAIIVQNVNFLEGDSDPGLLEFTVALDRMSAQSVTVDYATQDGSADASDYTATSGSLSWDVGDTTTRTVQVSVLGDVAFESDEHFFLLFDNVQNAVVATPNARGVVLNDDAFDYSVPTDGQPNDLMLEIDGPHVRLIHNGDVVVSVTSTIATPFTIRGADDVANSLVVDVIDATNALLGGVSFIGGSGTSDSLFVADGVSDSPVHTTYATDAGDFHIDGVTISYSGIESATDQLTPGITGASFSGQEGDTIEVNAVSPDPNATYAFSWSVYKDNQLFIDGSSSTLAFTSSDDGEYRVVLEAIAEGKADTSTVQVISVQNAAPIIALTGAAGVDEGSEYTLTLGDITDPGDDSVTELIVNWGDGSTSTYNGTGDVTHLYADGPLSPTITVDLVDEDGTHTSAGTSSLTVSNVDPTISAVTHNAEVDEASPLQFTVTATDPAGGNDPLTYWFDFDNNGTYETSDSDGVVSYAFADNGSYQVNVRVNDDDNGVTYASTTVTVNNVNPTINNVTDNGPIAEASAITVAIDASDPAGALDPLTYYFDFDNDNIFEVSGSNSSASNTYHDNGTYTVNVKVTDGDGGIVTNSTAVTITNADPTANGDSGETNEDQDVVINLLSNDTDPAGVNDPLTLVKLDGTDVVSGDSVLLASGATVTFNADSTVTFSPAADFDGNDGFTYGIDDGDGGTATGTVDVTVNNLVDLSGYVINDFDNDGEHDATDAGLSGVTVHLYDQSDNSLVDTQLTDADGYYRFNKNLANGSYRIVEEAVDILLDGKEKAGNLGGTVDNTQDNNAITDIAIGDAGSAVDGLNYLFAEIEPSDLLGLVWEDFNNDGGVNFGEGPITAVQIDLSGTDDRGNSVSRTVVSDADGVFTFVDLRPSSSAGYTIAESQPSSYDDGKDVVGEVNGVLTGDNDNGSPPLATTNDQFSSVVLDNPMSRGRNYNFAERPQSEGSVGDGQTAGIGFWQNNNGQELITSLNEGESSTQLANWLAATFPNMYGSSAGDNNLSDMTNQEVGDFYKTLFSRNKKSAAGGGPPKMDAQVLATALAVYVTNETLAGTTAADFGFTVTTNGVGTKTIDVGDNGDAFGADDNSDVQIIDLLLAVNERAAAGILFDLDGDGDADDGEETLFRTMANDIFSSINES